MSEEESDGAAAALDVSINDDVLLLGAVLFDGLLAAVLAALLVRSTLGTRPLALPTGGSSAGVVLLAALVFAAAVGLSVYDRVVERGDQLRVTGLIATGAFIAAGMVVLPAFGIPLDNWTIGIAEPFLGTTMLAVVLVPSFMWLAFGQALSNPRLQVRRAGAAIVDGILSLVLTYLIIWVAVPMVWRPPPTGATWGEVTGIFLGLFVCSVLARIPFEAYNGGSIGKYIAGIRVESLEGNNPTIRAVLIRNALRPIDSLPFWYVVGGAIIGVTDGQRIGDRLADTTVVRRRWWSFYGSIT
jgi:uncharacterized RDD family membrane protein YckC